MTEISWKLLKYLQKMQQRHLRIAPQEDLLTESQTLNTIKTINPDKDMFCQDKGLVFDEFSRFGEFSASFPKVFFEDRINLGTINLPKPGKTWFENDSGDLMGAFLHVQLQDPNNPFKISLKLPPIEPQKLNSDFPFPCITPATEIQEEKTGNSKFDWKNLEKFYEKNRNLTEFDPNNQKKYPMWENWEQKIRLQKSWKDIGEEYEKKIRVNLDENFCKSVGPMNPKDFIRSVKNLILCVPNQLFELGEYRVKLRFRLKSMSHSVIFNTLGTIVQFSKNYKFLSELAVGLQGKKDLISPSFAKGIRNVLSFIENYVIKVSDDLTLIQFIVQTQSLREQVRSLRTVCTDLPAGNKMIDYIYLILSKNEGDFENYNLLQKLFKNIVQPMLDSLSFFTFNAEINDYNAEFFIQDNKDYSNSQIFSVEKYFKGFIAIPTQIFASVIEPLLDIGRNLKMMKNLDRDLSPYFQLLSSGTISSLDTLMTPIPHFRLSYKTLKILEISDEFTAFNGEQTHCLMEIESKIIKAEQESAEKLNELKLQKQSKSKLLSTAQQKQENEKLMEKQRKQWSFYQTLENQLKENVELRRIAEEKRKKEEKKLEEKLEQEKRELIEKGKKLLLEEHEMRLNEIYKKTALENWKEKRKALNEKREIFWGKIKQAEANEIEGRMQVEGLEFIDGFKDEGGILVNECEKDDGNKLAFTPVYQDAAKRIIDSESIENSSFSRIRQPPGGFSTIQTLFNDPIEIPKLKIDPSNMPRIGYNAEVEKWEICSSLFYEEIVKKVFRKISPAKTWQASAKTEEFGSFKDLFEDFEDKKNASRNLVIPFGKVIEKLIVQPIKIQAEMVNKACLHLVTRKLKLVEHLKAFKRYALLEAGDTIDLFLNTIFSQSFGGNITAAWEGCLKMSSSKDDEYGELIKITMKTNEIYRMQFKTVEDLEFLQLSYKLQGPLCLIFSPNRIEEYSKAFVSLLRVKYITSVLSDIKTFKVPMNHIYYRKIHLLRQKMQHFIDIYHGYIASELHGAAWKAINNEIMKAHNLQDIIIAHHKYLDLILTRCFLKENGMRVMEQLKMIFQLVMRFRNIVLELDEFSLREIEAIEEDFNSIHRFLFKMTQTMAANGNYPELFLRLDFNYFMTDKIERERIL